MTEDYWSSVVYGTPPLEGLERSDDSAAFGWMSRKLPVIGSKIDWSRALGTHSHRHIDDDVQLAEIAVEEVCRRALPGTPVEHVGDGLSPYGVRFTAATCASVVAELLEIPEHHYFLAVDRSWIVVVTSEGDLDTVDELCFE